MRWILRAVVAGFLIVAAWFTWQAYHVYNDVKQATGKIVPHIVGEPTVSIPPLNGNRRTNFLILGSDNDRKTEEKRPLAQSIIVVSVDPKSNKVVMLSIPRDFYVPIQGHGTQKIDLAYKYGRVALARATVERLFGIPIHYYAWVGLNGFINVLNTFNGVTLDVTRPILDDSYPNDLNAVNPYGYKRVFIPAGWQHMDGAQALEYVRSRHGDLIGDFGRSTRQQQVLLQLNKKMTTLNVLENIVTLAHDLSTSVQTDITLDQLPQIGDLARKTRAQNVQQQVLSAPVYSTYAMVNGQSILRPNWDRICPLVRRMFAPYPGCKAGMPVPPKPRKTSKATVHSKHAGSQNPTKNSGHRSRPIPTLLPSPVPTVDAPPLSRLPSTLIYVREGNIFLANRQGNVRQLTFTGDAAMPSLSPDGRSVAFVRFDMRRYVSDLWIEDLKTNRLRQVTHDLGPPQEVRNNAWAAWPSWAPDGKSLAISWDIGKRNTPPSDARMVDLAVWQIGLDGSVIRQLTTPQQLTGGDNEPVWRPGSGQFAYIKWSYAGNQSYSQLVLQDTRTSQSSALTQTGGRVLQPNWDSQGHRLTFVRLTKGVDEVAVAPVTNGKSGPVLGPRTVIARGEIASPSFTPDGRWISYLRAQGDGFALYVAPSGGGPSRQVTAVGAGIDARWPPVWVR